MSIDPNEYKLICDVQLPPATIIKRGCTLNTLLVAIRQRENLPPAKRVFNNAASAEQSAPAQVVMPEYDDPELHTPGSPNWHSANSRNAALDEVTRLNASPAEQQTDATRDVLAERQRQIAFELWTPEHDDEHVCDEIAAFASFYAMPPAAREWDATSTGYGLTLGQAIVPEGWQTKTGDRRRELVIAGALILAELERLDRAAQRTGGAK